MKKICVLLFILTFVSSLPLAQAEEIDEIFKKVNKFISEKNYPKAIEELSWAKKEIEKLHNVRLKSFLPDELAGFKAGEINAQSALGFNTIERTYTGAGNSFTLGLNGGTSSSSNNPFGNLAALAKMGQMMGAAQPGVDTFRVQGKTVTLDTSSGVEAIVSLDSGSVLTLKSQSKFNAEIIKKAINELKLEDLDKYLKGNS